MFCEVDDGDFTGDTFFFTEEPNAAADDDDLEEEGRWICPREESNLRRPTRFEFLPTMH